MFYTLVMWLCSIVALLLLLDFYVKNYTTFKIAKSAQSPPMLPIIGSTLFLFQPQEKIHLIRMNMCKMFKNGYAYRSFGMFYYTIYSAHSAEKIFTNPKHIEKGRGYGLLHSLLSTGLLTSGGEKWFSRRKLLTPAFHFSILNGFKSNFKEHTEVLLRAIRENEVNNPNGTNLQKLIARFTLNIICASAMGVKPTKINELDDYRHQIDEFGRLHLERVLTPWNYNKWVWNIFGNGKLQKKVSDQAHAFTGSIIAKKRESFKSNQRQKKENNSESTDDVYSKKQRMAMLDTLLEAEQNNMIDAAGIQEEVDTFVFEGFDTTMTAITFNLLLLANHEDVQKRLYEEIASMEDDQDYSKLKYLDAVIKESLRLYPPVSLIGRLLGEDTVIDGVKIPAKTMVTIQIDMLHRDPKYFPNPDKFDPNRFLENDIKHPFAYVPFSAGQRNCIGQKFAMMELRTAIGEIVKNFELKPITKPEDVVIMADMVLRSKNPIRVQFSSRCS